jgi:hypothetical protein
MTPSRFSTFGPGTTRAVLVLVLTSLCGAGCDSPASAPACGNGKRETGEECDGEDVGAVTCRTLGYAGGSLTCGADCRFDQSACEQAWGCGNDVRDPGEECDGTDLQGATCVSLGYVGGTLACGSGCRFDESGCTASALCGNGRVDSGEECDGASLNGRTCASLGLGEGALTCSPACRFVTAGCHGYCGDGTANSGEECDGADLAGRSCASLGLVGGTLSCSSACHFVTTGCTCGNGTLDPGEECDAGNLRGATCESLRYPAGALGCDAHCQLDASHCGSCGDHICEPGETSASCPQDCGSVMTVKIALGIFRKIRTCLVGNPCTGTCADLKTSSNAAVNQFNADDAFKGLKPSDPAVQSYSNRLCLTLTMKEGGPQAVRDEVYAGADSMARQVMAASQNKMGIQVIAWEYDVEMTLSRSDRIVWPSSPDTRESMIGSMDPSFDGVLVSPSLFDRAQDIMIGINSCGGTYGANWGVGGAGYAWVPYSESPNGLCMNAQDYLHEWLHQVDFAYQFIMGMPDTYSHNVSGGWEDQYPTCHTGSSNLLAWFPSADCCQKDPDWYACGLPACPDLHGWNAHILGAHYDYSHVYLGNHCRDGIQDFDETGVDVGGRNCTYR